MPELGTQRPQISMPVILYRLYIILRRQQHFPRFQIPQIRGRISCRWPIYTTNQPCLSMAPHTRQDPPIYLKSIHTSQDRLPPQWTKTPPKPPKPENPKLTCTANAQ